MNIIGEIYAEIGTTVIQHGMVDRELAEKIANHFYDVREVSKTESGWSVRTNHGWDALIGVIEHQTFGWTPAILHKTWPLRQIEFIQL